MMADDLGCAEGQCQAPVPSRIASSKHVLSSICAFGMRLSLVFQDPSQLPAILAKLPRVSTLALCGPAPSLDVVLNALDALPTQPIYLNLSMLGYPLNSLARQGVRSTLNAGQHSCAALLNLRFCLRKLACKLIDGRSVAHALIDRLAVAEICRALQEVHIIYPEEHMVRHIDSVHKLLDAAQLLECLALMEYPIIREPVLPSFSFLQVSQVIS